MKFNVCLILSFWFLTISQEILSDPLKIISIIKTDESCNYSDDGTITVQVSGGVKPYTYSIWKPPIFKTSPSTNDSVYLFTGLEAGLYQLTVADQDTFVTNIINLTQPAEIILISELATPVTCNGFNDGTITVAASGGTIPYTYTLNPGNISNSTGFFDGLTKGPYTVSVIDSKACGPVLSNPLVITEPDAMIMTELTSSDITCNGYNDGAITMTVSGGNPPLTYTLTPGGISNSTGTFSLLSPDTYSINVTDSKGCPALNSGDVIIPDPPVISIVSQSFTNITCNGLNNGTISVSATGGTGTLIYTLDPGSINNTSGNFMNLGPDNYTVSVSDANSCPAAVTAPMPVAEPAPIVINSESATDISCFANNDGTITVTASGGTGSLQYTLNPGGITITTGLFTGLTDGSYTVSVNDSLNCGPVVSSSLVINRPSVISVASYDSSNITCHNYNDGIINVTGTGGTGTLTYTLNPGGIKNTSGSFSSLSQGVYSIEINDANSCPSVTIPSININNPDPISVTNESYTDITCNGLNNGSISVSATGGTGTLIYTLDPGSINNTSGNFMNLGPDNYTVSVSDANTCPAAVTAPMPVAEPTPIVINTETATDISCFANNDGTITVTASGGTGPLQYTLNPGGITNTTGLFTGLTDGSYTVSVNDSLNCGPVVSSSLVINRPSEISLVSLTSSDITCHSFNDGTIQVTGSGGTAPLVYTLNPGSVINNTGDFNSLEAGVYTITISDLNNCPGVSTTPVTINEPPEITITSQSSTNISCNGNNDGSITITASGGTGSLSFTIDPLSLTQDTGYFSELSQGTYTIAVTDENNCPADTSDPVNIINPPPLVIISEARTNVVTCYNDSTGSVSLVVNGGTGTIEYSLDELTWQSTGDFTGLPAGSYQITARDENGCTLSSSVLNISEPPAITATITYTPYFDLSRKGTITISGASGGTGSLEYSIYGTGGPFSSITYYDDLDPDTYHVVIRDANGCTFEQDVVIISLPPLTVTVNIKPVTCNGDNDASITINVTNGTGVVMYSIDDSTTWSTSGYFEGLAPDTFYIFIKDEDLRYFRDTVIFTDPPPLIVIADITPASCSSMSPDGAIDLTVTGGVGIKTYLWSNGAVSEDISGIVAGDYSVNVTDENGCTVKDTHTVTGLTIVNAYAGEDTILCSGEAIILSGQGGTTYSWDPVTGLSNPNIPNPVATLSGDISYVLTVVGLNNCYDTDTINISIYPTVGINAGNDTSILINQSAILRATGGGTFSNYSWSPPEDLSNPNSAITQATPLITTSYVVTAINNYGCTESDTVLIKVVENLKIYNAFSPNNDQINDFWDIDNAEAFPDIIVEVYTRWGEKVFSSQGYSHDKRWNGKIKGKDAPIGTYYYVVIPSKGANPLTGPLTIVR